MAEEAKSVITIDVDATAFENFKKLFDEFQAALDKLPAQWAAINAAQMSTQAGTADQAKIAADKITKVYDDLAKKEEQRKANAEKAAETRLQKQLDKAKTKEQKEALLAADAERKKAEKAEDAAKKIAEKEEAVRRSQAAKQEAAEVKQLDEKKKRFFNFVKNGIFAIPELAALAAGLTAAYKFAEQSASLRRESRALGVTPGQLNAVKDTYGTLLSDPSGLLGNIAQAQTSYAGRAKLQVLSGGAISAADAQNKSAAELLPQVLAAIRDRYQQNPTEEYAKSKFINEFISESDRRALGQARQQEIDELNNSARAQAASNAQLDQSLKVWSDLWTSFKKFGSALFHIVGSLLTPIASLLKMILDGWAGIFNILSSANDKLMAFFAKIPIIGSLYGESSNIKNPLDTSRSPTSRSTDDAKQANTAIQQAQAATAVHERNTAANGGQSRAERNHNWGNLKATRLQQMFGSVASDAQGFRKFASDEEGFKAMQNQLKIYQTRGLTTVESIVKRWAPPSENPTAAYIQRVAKDTGFAPGAQLNMNDPAIMSKLIAAMARVESGKNRYSSDQIKLMIQNNTGGSAVVSASAMAGMQGAY